MGPLAKTAAPPIARPLRVLVPLIQDDIKQGREAANRAGIPFYRAAGAKLLEAKGQIPHGDFHQWIVRNFGVKKTQAAVWMRLAEEKSGAPDFASLGDFIRKTGTNPTYNTFASKKQAWEEPVRAVLDQVDTETLNLKRDELKRADEREAQRQLARQLIDIGYKVLARTLHPDKGGSREAMVRLNAVRDRLKQCI